MTNLAQSNKLRSLRFGLPILLLLFAVSIGLFLYISEMRIHETKFETVFLRNQMLQTAGIQSDIERWVLRNDMEMVQSIFAELGVNPNLKMALFLDAENTVLAATRRDYIGQALNIEFLGLDNLNNEKLHSVMQIARHTIRGSSMFTNDRNEMIACFPTSLPLQPGDLGVNRGGMILVCYDLRYEKADNIHTIKIDFLILFASILIIAMALGISMHFLITSRLEKLKLAMTSFADGKTIVQYPSKIGDEISHLVIGFNEMASTISKTMEEIQDLYNRAPCGYHSLDASGVFVRINDTELSWLGYTREEMEGKMKFSDLLTPQSRILFQQEFSGFKVHGWIHNLDLDIVLKNGVVMPVVLNDTAINDADGNFIMSRSVVHDVTERKQAEEALRESELRFRRITEGLTDYRYQVRIENGKAVETIQSEACTAVTGYTPTDFKTDPYLWYRMIVPEDQEFVRESLQKILSGVSIPPIEHRIIRKDRMVRWVCNTPILFRDTTGQVLSYEGVIKDITDRKQAEEEIRKLNQKLEKRVVERTLQLEIANKELESFAYSVAHDLRTPLRGIDGFCQILIDDNQDKLDKKAKSYLQRVRSAAQRMAQLIDNLLNLSHISRCEMNISQVNLSKIAREVADNLCATHPHRNVETIIQEGIETKGDISLLKIVLENLIENAWKFTSKHPTAYIEFGMNKLEGKKVFYIRDNGAGFNMDHAKKIFGAFQRMHTIIEFEGTGIGLATVQRIIHRHGGKIWAQSEVEKGATFYFTIP